MFTSPQVSNLLSTVYLQLNQPASPATINTQNILVIGASTFNTPQISYDMATRRIVLNNVDGTIHVVVGPGVLSQTGTPLEPFASDFELHGLPRSYASGGTPTTGPFLRPGPFSTTFPLGSPIVLYFQQPMQRDLVERTLRIYSGSSQLAGRIEWTPDSTALNFFPATPLGYSTGGVVVLSLIPWGGVGADVMNFSIEQAPFTPTFPHWNLTDVFPLVPNDTVIDVELQTAPPDGYIISANAQTSDTSGPKTIPLEVQTLSPKRFRFRSARPFPVSNGVQVIAKTKDADLKSPYFQTAAYATPATHAVFTGPTLAAGPAPVNTMIWVESQTPLNSVPFTASLTVDGQSVPFTTEITDQGHLVRLHPLGLLRGNATYTVALTGLEDMAGRAIPDRTWQFQTGAGPDFTGPQVVSWSPVGVAPASSTLKVTFDRPVHLLRHSPSNYDVNATDFSVRTPSADIPGNISYSEDGKTLSYIPLRPWPANTAIGLTIVAFHYYGGTGAALNETRLGGNNLLVPGFTTALPSTLPSPAIDAVNPYRDAPNAPLNVQIQARFVEPLDLNGLHIRFERDGATVPANITMGADGRTVTVAPVSILAPNATYMVTIDGVDSWSFHTAAAIQATGSTAAITRIVGDAISFRVDASVPWNTAAIAPSAFTLVVAQRLEAFTLRTDGSSIVVIPVAPIPSGAACYLTAKLSDWAGNAISGSLNVPNCALTTDGTPPRLSLLPADGGVMAWNDSAIVTGDEPFVLRYGAAGVQLSTNGVPVPVIVQRTGPANMFVLHPVGDWIPGAAYQVDMRGIADNDGNEVPPMTWSFSIAGDGAADSTTLRLVSSTPAQNAVGVPPDTAIAFDFSKPVAPNDAPFSGTPSVSVQFKESFADLSSQFKASYQGAHVEFAPGRLPASGFVSAAVSVRDLSGLRVNANLRFNTAASPDTTPPTVDSISPAPGSKVTGSAQDFMVRFSEPVMLSGGAAAQFSAGGQVYSASASTFPIAGDGRTMVFSFQLPPSASGTLNLLSSIVDLAGNPLVPVSLAYTTSTANEVGFRVISITPGDNASGVSPSAPIEIKFSQPVAMDGLAPYLQVMNDGVLIAVTLSGDQDGLTWRATPPSPWLPGTTVSVEVGALAYSTSGALLWTPAKARFVIAASATNDTVSNRVAAIISTAEAIDIRFAQPRSHAPGEPFGIRLRQQRVSATIQQMGPAWFRIVPDGQLNPAESYVLMAGDGVEFPVLLRPAESVETSESTKVDDQGNIHVRWNGSHHRFSFTAESVRLLDSAGQPIPFDAHMSVSEPELILTPYRRSESYRVVLR